MNVVNHHSITVALGTKHTHIYIGLGFKANVLIEDFSKPHLITCYKVGTQIGTQKCADRAVEAVDAAHAVQIFPRKFSAC